MCDDDEIPRALTHGEPRDRDDDMSEEDLEDFLAEALEALADESGLPHPRIRTFADAGVLTGNRGLVVRIGGAEFQVTVVRSR
jgi:hypothetical protein